MRGNVADQSVVSVVALEIEHDKESDFLTLTGQLQALVRRKGYGTNQLLRDGSQARRYYDIRIWRNGEAAARAEADEDLAELRKGLLRTVTATPLVDVAWAVEIGLASAGPWQERRGGSDRRASNDRRVQNAGRAEGDRRVALDRRMGPRRVDDPAQPDIVQSARSARDRALATYSNFKVGAALETADGRVVTGANIENATYGLTMCAERVAMFKALSEGHRSFRRLAIVADTDRPTTPCGACRQVLWEFGGNLEVILADLHGVRARHQLKDLLPHPFDALFLE
jgi:cytidine deaminase